MVATVYEQFRAAAIGTPDAAFLCYPSNPGRGYWPKGVEFSYGEALDMVECLAENYRQAGYGAGHRIALAVGNRPEHFWHLFALNAIGATVVTLNPDYRPHEMAFGIAFPECRLVVTAQPWLGKLREAIASLDTPVPVFDVESPDAPIPAPAGVAHSCPSDPAERIALVIYTSGTTGRPKGCMISNYSCLAAGESYSSAGGLIAFRKGGDRLYCPLPAFHMNVSVYTLNTLTLLGNCLIMQDRFSASRWWSDLAESQATCFHYLGIIPPILVKADPVAGERQPHLRFGYGAGVDPLVREAFEERIGVPLVEAWGMTETSRAIQNSSLPRCLEPRAFGRPRAPWEVRIVDDNEVDVAVGEPGELIVRASGSDPRAGFFSGYINQPDETEKAWRGGWFHTGDIVRQADDGMLFFVDRKKNIIRRSGENIAAAEIENALLDLDEVKGAAVLAVEDDLHDEEIMACLTLMPGVVADEASALAIQRRALDSLGAAKVPAWIVFLDALPVTGTQKVQKGQIFDEGVDPRADPRSLDLRAAKRDLRRLESSA